MADTVPGGVMTDEEALALREGDAVLANVGGDRRVPCVVSRVEWLGASGVYLSLRRRGRPAWRRRPFNRWGWQVEKSPDPAPANVYADWLEEQGEYRAARLLREAFPLGGRSDG